ncbi:MAG TPA: hypothetical protein VK892_03380 [Pyrinomonadaceae bacterium]|nr:hypothetical protein [Pyrinomonadaceae bacterium]
MKYLPIILLLIITLAISASAQQGQGAGAKYTAEIIATSSTSVVKGAPFSAEAVSESVQILADGNRISRSFTTKMFRDSEGRFRREGGSGGSGNVTYSGAVSALGLQDTISIFDPVINVRYILQPSNKTARKIDTIAGVAEAAVIANGQPLSHATKTYIELNAARRAEATAQAEVTAVGRANVVVLPSLVATHSDGPGKTESLGTRNIEGVEAEGTRTVTTLAPGAIGNEREIEIVYERWYSKELQLIVYSRHFDPRFGEQTYRLTNISRSEPDRSLFVPPSDYNVVSEPVFNRVTTRPTYNVVKPRQ